MTNGIIVPETGVVKMGYGFSPGAGRRAYSDRNDPLYDAFGKWLDFAEKALDDKNGPVDRNPGLRKEAGKLIYQIRGFRKITSSQINSVLSEYKSDERISKCKNFLRVLYNTIEEENLVFDVEGDFAVMGVGEGLKAGKKLLILSDVVGNIGHRSQGDIINYSESRDLFGDLSYGCLVNFGKIGYLPSTCSLLINMGSIEEVDYHMEEVAYTFILRFSGSWNHFFGSFGDYGNLALASLPSFAEYLDRVEEMAEKLRDPKDPEVFKNFDKFLAFAGNREIYKKKLLELGQMELYGTDT